MSHAVLALLAATMLWSCSGGRKSEPRIEQPRSTPAIGEVNRMSGQIEGQTNNSATSPDGDKHPGEIVHDDRIQGRTWTQKASAVPQSIAWVQVDGKWKPVVKIQMTGNAERQEITSFGPGGEFLQTTMSSPQPQAGQLPQPDPVPMPEPASTH